MSLYLAEANEAIPSTAVGMIASSKDSKQLADRGSGKELPSDGAALPVPEASGHWEVKDLPYLSCPHQLVCGDRVPNNWENMD